MNLRKAISGFLAITMLVPLLSVSSVSAEYSPNLPYTQDFEDSSELMEEFEAGLWSGASGDVSVENGKLKIPSNTSINIELEKFGLKTDGTEYEISFDVNVESWVNSSNYARFDVQLRNDTGYKSLFAILSYNDATKAEVALLGQWKGANGVKSHSVKFNYIPQSGLLSGAIGNWASQSATWSQGMAAGMLRFGAGQDTVFVDNINIVEKYVYKASLPIDESFEEETEEIWELQCSSGLWPGFENVSRADGKLIIPKGKTLGLNLGALNLETDGTCYEIGLKIGSDEWVETTKYNRAEVMMQNANGQQSIFAVLTYDTPSKAEVALLGQWKGGNGIKEHTIKFLYNPQTGLISGTIGSWASQSITWSAGTAPTRMNILANGDDEIYIDDLYIHKKYMVNLNSNDENGGTLEGAGTYDEGAEVIISAKTNEGYSFEGWYENGELVSSEPNFAFIAERTVELSAKFKDLYPEYEVKAVSESDEKGTVSGGGIYAEDAEIILKANPKAGYKFLGWYEGESLINAENPWNFKSEEGVDGKEYTAKFDNSSYIEAMAKLKEKIENEDKDGFVQMFDRNLTQNLAFSTGYEDIVDLSEVAELMYNEFTKEDASELGTDAEYEFIVYKALVTAELLNNNKDVKISEMLADLIKADEEMEKFSKLHIKNEEAEEFLSDVMKYKNTSEEITDVESLIDTLKKGLVLTGVEYPDGSGSIRNLFEAYKELLDLNSVSKYTSVWNSLADEDDTYKNVEDLLEFYDELVLTASKKENSGGGKGSGGGSSTGSGGKPVINGNAPVASQVVSVQKTENSQSVISMRFKDLNSVPWAYSAIARMFDKKVINGYSETEFRPESTVTREQYVKMLVGAMNLSLEATEVNFADVDNNAWFKPYISVAVKCGFVNGMGNNIFGTGLEITRQDMAVMTYKAALYKGLVPKNAGLNFNDSANISDYAKEAVAELSALGIINGVGDGNFEPNSVATRAQAAVIIDNVFEYLR